MAFPSKIKRILECGDKLFSDRSPLLNLWQTTAENFYPERADFSVSRALGTEFASHLQTGYPVMARRDLANSISSMLRPRGKPWFYARTDNDDLNKMPEVRQWLDDKSDVMRRLMYDRRANFVRATKEGDNDFAAFGQAVLQVPLRRDRTGLLFRCFHLRDVAWTEDAEGRVDQVHRNWEVPARQLIGLFPTTVSDKVRKIAEKTPEQLIKCRHVVVPSTEYEYTGAAMNPGYRRKLPFISLYIDRDNEVVMEEVPVKRIDYVIPRWQTVAGSQYAHSPATVVALADARMLQQITLTLLEAGQKAVDPPMVAVGEAITGGINLYAGGVTWVDAEYDERLGEVLRPVSDRKDALNWGVDREERISRLIQSAFYLDQIHLPMDSGAEKMTATETQIRYEDYMRKALPLFEPMEMEYNGALCDIVFELGWEHGAFGAPQDIPEALRGQEIKFQFESPIQQAAGRANAQAFQTSAQLLAIAAQIDPSSIQTFNTTVALRDALEGAGAPAEWVYEKEEADSRIEQAKEEQGAAAEMAQIQQGADAAQSAGGAVDKFASAAQKTAQSGGEEVKPGYMGVSSKKAMAYSKTPDPIVAAMDSLRSR